MIKAEMLNEMNPKLKALLAAGLIGTASLGAASCSMPTDDPTGYEQPTPETTNSVPTVTFESLGVAPEHAVRLAGADEFENNVTTIGKIQNYNSFIYKSNEDGFVQIKFDPASEPINRKGAYEDGSSYISYINDTDDADRYLYYVPTSMKSYFDAAIAAYKATYAE